MTRSLRPAALFVAALAVAGVGAAHNSQDQNPGPVLAPLAQAPAKARARKNPYEGDTDAVAAGEKLYRQHCAECHGDDAQGNNGRAANLRSPLVQNATPGQLAWLLRNGNLWHGMPPWAGIPEQRRWQIVSYLKSLGAAHAGATNSTQRSAGQ